MTIRRIESKEIRKIGRPGVTGPEAAPPAGLSPILRAAWPFAKKTAARFSEELSPDPKRKTNFVAEALKNLAKRFQ
ncbi:MAG: hypothetical protein JW873_03635 [Candidatus Saganbacteria bacterium]|nr:hypothetical protein [Candidatus Saganbacteria bacterium]